MANDQGRTEEWRDVVGYEGHYRVSSTGKVSGKRVSVLRFFITASGYATVHLNRPGGGGKGHFVHKLVCAAFVGPRPTGHQINHIDGIKTNNDVRNLEYVPPAANVAHQIGVLGHSRNGERNGRSILTQDQVSLIRGPLRNVSCLVLARRFGVCKSTINYARNATTWG